MNNDKKLPLHWLFIPWAFLALYCFGYHYPVALDLPNLTARAFILSKCLGGAAEPLCAHYLVHWSPFPYFLSDLVLMGLLQLFSPLLAQAAALFFACSLVLTGWFTLSQTVAPGTRAAYLAGLLLVLNNLALKGFFGFTIGSGLLLWWLSFWWPRRDDRSGATTAKLCIFLALIFSVHLAPFVSALVFYFGYDCFRLVGTPGFQRKEVLLQALRGWPLALAFVVLYGCQQLASGGSLTAATASQGFGAPLGRSWWFAKTVRLSYLFWNYSRAVDLAILGITAMILLLASKRRPSGGFVRNYWFVLAGCFFGLYLITPDISHGAVDVDLRFLLPAFVALLLSGAEELLWDYRQAAPLFVLLVAHAGYHLHFKALAQPELERVERAIHSLPPGSSLMEFNSRTSFPDTLGSRINIFSHASAAYIHSSGLIVDGLFNCGTNPNTVYFCYRDPTLRVPDYRAQFGGLTELDKNQLMKASHRYRFFLVIDPDSQRVRQKLEGLKLRQRFQEQDVYIFESEAPLEPPVVEAETDA